MPSFRFSRSENSSGSLKVRWILALIIVIASLASYYGSSEYNDITGQTQRVALSEKQEIALGLQAAPQMLKEYGGLYASPQDQAIIDKVGQRVVNSSAASKTDYQFEFHLLADDSTVNAFALPGGQIFITYALYSQFTREDQLAGVLAHEVGHVIARHGAQHLAKQRLTQGLTTATAIGLDDYRAGQMAAIIGSMVNMKYGREDEIESDLLGVRFLHEAGYDPQAMVEVMEILAKAAGGNRSIEFFSTHPNPENRIARIKEAVKQQQLTH